MSSWASSFKFETAFGSISGMSGFQSGISGLGHTRSFRDETWSIRVSASWTRVTLPSFICHLTLSLAHVSVRVFHLGVSSQLSLSLPHSLPLLLSLPRPWRSSHPSSAIEGPSPRRSFAGDRRRRAAPPRPRLLGASPSFSFLSLKPRARRTTSSFTKPSSPSRNPC